MTPEQREQALTPECAGWKGGEPCPHDPRFMIQNGEFYACGWHLAWALLNLYGDDPKRFSVRRLW